ncbi:hypothetical protein GCM10011492_21000 [Flexivirga endophytica]|uniref:Uncharacterized protein n=1 Tax=Flexivirga endophytica TaxID=1849103 RepID=A0A916WT44_9MICO|nr:hypothetical protein [Flexivirga endophytica]GGB30355.1 hypothetical protein GCM10011492_21000 [Flexivirga endophytica]GHB51266.1 hypothetical protein GCM10008112_20270 [Flexivirga endophytica]
MSSNGGDDGRLKFSDALRTAIRERGLSLSRLRVHLADKGFDVGTATLSTWQSGARVPRDGSVGVLEALEEVLDVPSGWLVERLEPARLSAVRPRRPFAVVDESDALARLLGTLDGAAHGQLRTTGVAEEVVLSATGGLAVKHVVQAVQAVRSADRLVIVHQTEPDGDIAAVSPEAIGGCRVGRVARDRERGLLVAELLVDRRLAVDETAVLRYDVHDRATHPMTEYFRFHEWPVTHHSLEVRFDPAALPVRVMEFARKTSGSPDIVRREITLSQDRRAQVVVPAAEPGIVGIDWQWG